MVPLFAVLAACGGSDEAASVVSCAAPTPCVPASTAPVVTNPVSLEDVDYPPAWDSAVEIVVVEPASQAEEPVEIEVGEEIVEETAVAELELVDGDELTFPGDVLFTTDSDVLTTDSDALFEQFAAAARVQLANDLSLEVHGWVDSRGDAAHNLDLAQRRANAVQARVLRLVPELDGRISAAGHGKDDLLDPTCIGDCPRNRAVTVVVFTTTP
jgi:outer membrane protein OmpA-like peptidoglycan-associated protein